MEGTSDLRFDFSIDRGGTFTDVYYEIYTPSSPDPISSNLLKLLSEDPSYSDAPREAIRRVLSSHLNVPIPLQQKLISKNIRSIRMGTTVATNALLERKGSKTGLLITKGFRDLMLIGTQNRQKIFDLEMKKPERLFNEVLEIEERVRLIKQGENIECIQGKIEKGVSGDDFEIMEEIDQERTEQKLKELKSSGVESLAIVLMFSYSFPKHELILEQLAKKAGFSFISVSHKVVPMVKIVPRGFTTILDAYLNPHILHYLSQFIDGFDSNIKYTQVYFMQSDGGMCPIGDFIGSRAILSGPAGGVIGYSKNTILSDLPELFTREKFRGIIGFDMGGTSTDVSRFDLLSGQNDIVFDSEIAGIAIKSPHLDINTVAAGGGSRLFFENNVFKVGPESSGANPGPICYGNNGFMSITDANLILGRIQAKYFPSIFGKKRNETLDFQASRFAFEELTSKINGMLGTSMNIYEVAYGYVKVANENMCRPIRNLTQGKGLDQRHDLINVFGGAGGQHACEIAQMLGISGIYLHKYAGILSAYGLAQADVVIENSRPITLVLKGDKMMEIEGILEELARENREKLGKQGFLDAEMKDLSFLNLRYQGTDTSIMVLRQQGKSFEEEFIEIYMREFGFLLKDRKILVDNLRVRSVANKITANGKRNEKKGKEKSFEKCNVKPLSYEKVYFNDKSSNILKAVETPNYSMESLQIDSYLDGPVVILNQTGTILVDIGWRALITSQNDIFMYPLEVQNVEKAMKEIPKYADPIELAIFGNRFMSIAEQMGRTLQRTSISTNIKERLDFSCALFGPNGDLVANAPHLPVHLGSMQEAVKFQIKHLKMSWKEGEVIVSNHPKAGGSHLPDITVISPVWSAGRPVFYVASRGHHADIGGITPGSMPPMSRKLKEEGVAIISERLVIGTEFQEENITKILMDDGNGTRSLKDNISDLKAQVAANNKGISLINELILEYGLEYVLTYMRFIQENAEECVRRMLVDLSLKNSLREYDSISETEYMDDGSMIRLKLSIDRNQRSAMFDFTGTGLQVIGNTNNPRAVTMSAIIYCLRCLVNKDIPLNQGCLMPISVIIPEGSLLDPDEDAAIVGGNVLTSQRVTDVVFKAFKACAASQGCMNNVTFGNSSFSYYETIAGGGGAGPGFNGQSGVHSHMTNTRITDPEILEIRYPVILRRFNLREDQSGGGGKFKGGEGVVREFEFLEPVKFSILSERRVFKPYGMKGGEDGKTGLNLVFEKGRWKNLGGKNSIDLVKHDRVLICSPGGGGFGLRTEGEMKTEEKERKIEEEQAIERGSLHFYQKMQEGA